MSQSRLSSGVIAASMSSPLCATRPIKVDVCRREESLSEPLCRPLPISRPAQHSDSTNKPARQIKQVVILQAHARGDPLAMTATCLRLQPLPYAHSPIHVTSLPLCRLERVGSSAGTQAN